MKNEDKRVGKNPAGYLVASIRSDYEAPTEFAKAKSKTNAAEKAVQTAEEDRKQKRKAKDESIQAKAREIQLQDRWERLTEAERDVIIAAVKASNPSIGRFKNMLEPLCLAALEKKLASELPGTQQGLFPDIE